MSLASSIGTMLNQKKPVTAALAYYDPVLGEEKGITSGFVGLKKQINKSYQAFQYFPEKITDTKAVEYASKSIPGGSHPIYTFISGGERTITFDAIFVNDEGPSLRFLEGGVRLSTFNKRKEVHKRKEVQDVAAGIAWLRYCLYPTYNSGVAKAPPLVILYLPQSGIIGEDTNQDSIIGILTRADVTYESFYRDGKPRLAVVSCEVKEVVQTKKKWQFVDGNSIDYSSYINPPRNEY